MKMPIIKILSSVIFFTFSLATLLLCIGAAAIAFFTFPAVYYNFRYVWAILLVYAACPVALYFNHRMRCAKKDEATAFFTALLSVAIFLLLVMANFSFNLGKIASYLKSIGL